MTKQRLKEYEEDINYTIKAAKMKEPKASEWRQEMMSCYDDDEEKQFDKIAKTIRKSLEGLE